MKQTLREPNTRGGSYIEPYVSYVEQDNTLHYNKPPETRVVAKFNVTSTSEPTTICYSTSNFSEMEIDGVVHQSVVNSYIFGTTGEHTVKYTLTDPTQIGDSAFEDCHLLTNVTIPNSVTSIGDRAFEECALTSIIIPDSVTNIGWNAVRDCNLTNVTIPDSVTSIGDRAFLGNEGLNTIEIGSGVTNIGTEVFDNCKVVTNIIVKAVIPPTIGSTVFYYSETCPIYVPSQSVDAYKAASGWSRYSSRIQAIPTA